MSNSTTYTSRSLMNTLLVRPLQHVRLRIRPRRNVLVTIGWVHGLLIFLSGIAQAQGTGNCPSAGSDITVTSSTAKLPPAPAGSEWRPNGGNTATIDNQGNISGLTANGTYSFLLVTSGSTCGSKNTLTEKIYSDFRSAALGGQFATVPCGNDACVPFSFGTLADAAPNADPGLYGTNSPNTLIFNIDNRTIHYVEASDTYVSGTPYKLTVNYNPISDRLTYTINGQTLSFNPKAVNPSWPTGSFMSATMLYLASSMAGQRVDVTNIKLNGSPLTNNSLTIENGAQALVVSGYDYYNGFNVTADVTFTFATQPTNGGALFFDYKFGRTTGCNGDDNGCIDEVIVTKTAPPCSVALSATPGSCNPATNQYMVSGIISLTSVVAGTATITDGTATTTVAVAAGDGSVNYSLAGLTSNGVSHTIFVTLPNCGSASTTYTAPASCTVAPCGLAMTLTPGLCQVATNAYVLSGTIAATNVPTSGTLTLSSGAFSSRTIALPVAANVSGTFSYSGLVSNGQPYTVTASYSNAACAPISQTYTAPVSCSIAPVCSLSATATAGLCGTATNAYSATVVVQLTSANAGTLTVSLPGSTPISQTIAANTRSFTAVFPGLPSDGIDHTATVSLPGCGTTTAPYTAPSSCSVAPVCSLSAVATAGQCQTATNTYSSTVVVTVTNPSTGTLSVSDGAQTLTFSTTANAQNTFMAVFQGLGSDGSLHAVVASLPGCSSVTTTYSAPASCSVAPICSLSAMVNAGACNPTTNSFSSTVVVTVANPAGGQTLTVTDGVSSQPLTTTAGSSNTFTVVFPGLPASGTMRTVRVSLPGCSSTTTAYTAPASCSVAPVCSISAVASPGVCASATNTYSSTILVTMTNPDAATLTVTDGPASITVSVPATTGQVSVPAIFNGLSAMGSTHIVTVSLPGCSSVTTTYQAPVSCSAVSSPRVTIQKQVSKSVARLGDVLTYTVVLTNQGSVPASNVVVRDSSSTGLHFVAGSAVTPASTTFVYGSPVSRWTVASLDAGQSLRLTFQAQADSSGILYNVASIPGDTAQVCTSVPLKICPGDAYSLSVPAGRAAYHWYKDGVLIPNQTSNVLLISQPGSYSLGVDNVGSACPDYSCCPLLVEIDSLPVYQAATVAASCQGNIAQNNAQLVLSRFNPAHTYQYSVGSTFNPAASLSGLPKAIPTSGVLSTGLTNPGSMTAYTVRVYNSLGCYTDATVMLMPTVCGCPVEKCVPFVMKQTKGLRRIGQSGK